MEDAPVTDWPLAAPPRFTRPELVLIAVAVLGFLVLALALIQQASALGHDESVYGVRAVEFAGGEPGATWFAAYRAPGLPWTLATLPIGIGSGRFRMVVALFGVLGLLSTWILGRTLVNVMTGLLAAGLLALTPVWLFNSTLLLPDVAGAAVGTAAAAVLAVALTRPRLPAWTWAIVPLAMAATWIRFGAPLPLGVALATLVAFAWPRVRTQVWQVLALGVATAVGSAAILLVPAMTGTEQSAADAIRNFGATRPNVFTTTLGDFWSMAPDVFGNWLGALLLVSVGAGVVFLVAGRGRGIRRGLAWALLASLLMVAGWSATLSHGEGRYLAPMLPLVALLVAAALSWVARLVPRPVAGVVLVVLAAGMGWSSYQVSVARHDRQDANFDLLRDAGERIVADPALPCPVVTSYAPQVEWYSGCDTLIFGDPVPDRVGQEPFTIVVVQRGKRQPTAEELAPWTDSAEGPAVLDEGGEGVLDRIELYGVARRTMPAE